IFIDQPVIPFFSGVTIPAFACVGTVLAPLPTTSINGITGNWSPAINNSVTTTYTFTPDSGQCATIAALSIVIVDNAVRAENHYVCVDALGNALTTILIDTGLSPADNSFSWTFNGGPDANTASSYPTNIPGTYVVVATNLMTGCTAMTLTAEVIAIVPATAIATVSNDFDDVQQIVVAITGGLGDYEYQLDNGPFQTSNVFHITDGGDYTINVRDNLGCNSFQLHVTALSFPNFFTPNGDGFNDTWNIKGLPNNQDARISIFDRYGKLVKQIATRGNGWDGLYNGNELPSTDYWFLLNYEDKNGVRKEFKSHFSLKR
ncbi:MAG TPA: T9SS type B sorting domain-containing protein, partial [Flavobacterium sp.]|nr:T9SS type B sorting domain-containing protein [Flavobacterium sp.]